MYKDALMEELKKFQKGFNSRYYPTRVFDWHKAAEIIKKEKPKHADAFLGQDEAWTGGCIYHEGPVLEYNGTYLASRWAIPMLRLDDNDPIPCWCWQNEQPNWDAETLWPESALKILNEIL